MLFAGSQMLGTGLPTCVSGIASHRGRTVGRLLKRLQVRGLRPVPREMAPGAPALLLLSLLSLPGLPPLAAGCPTACRCYSATVECGALRLRVVPPGIPPGTQTLFLQDNSIARLEPGILASLASLRHLYLHNNSLHALESGAFRAQSRLLELALTGNRLRGLRVGAFAGLAQLRVLYLAGNQLVQLLDFTFLHLQRLQELHLQENSIELLEDQALAGLSSLALLDLSRNQLGTISREALQPLASLQVLRLTENPWRCDCALHWLGAWIKEGGQRLLSSRDKKILCAEPPRLALQSLLEVSGSSLICIPPSVHVEPLEMTANLGEDLRVACQASGYPQPLVTWRKVAQPREAAPRAQAQPEAGWRRPGGLGASDTGSGMLFLTNITLAHAGKYECEASNAGGATRVPFQLLVNVSRQQQLAPPPPPAGGPVSHEPLPEAGSMAFRALGLATQTAIAAAIALLALTALLLATMICRRRRRRKKAPGPPGEGALFVNDYSDGPCTFAQLEELRDERGHEMFVIDRSKPLFAEGSAEAAEAPGVSQGLPLQAPSAYEIHC
ncbi:leucine-rich repeat-containing protein 24 isoform X3 [Moschus berezovskii]|uniref:leucine-rich repeat-containing protein 24 isoform X3 n=1 Tax=Moschus berezovskii TaxID=68408 RepID=UPI0024441AC5|nr:leucine-rich repeat-containing protein 24 isoform X3 [Moschus berezovskii]